MKKWHQLAFITITLLLMTSLAACSNNTQSATSASHTSSAKVTKKQARKATASFKDNIIKTQDMQIKLTNMQIVKPGSTTNNKNLLRIEFEITNFSNKDMKPIMGDKFLNVYQVINNQAVKLNTGATLLRDQQITAEQNNTIKKNNTAKGVITFNLQNIVDPVKLVALDDNNHQIGSEMIQMGQLKQINDSNNLIQQNQSSVITNNSSSVTAVVPGTNDAATQMATKQASSYQPTNVNNTPAKTPSTTTTQQYTDQGHYPMWKKGNIYYAQLPDGTIMSETFADGSDPGTYEGDPEVQHETDELQEQWLKEQQKTATTSSAAVN